MGLREKGLTGRNVEQTCERQTGLLLQPPASMTHGRDATTGTVIPTTVGAVDTPAVNVEFGVPFVIHIGISVGDDGGGAITVQNRVFGTDGSPWKFRVLQNWVHTVDNDDTSMSFQLYHYTLDTDGALDTATAMTDAVTISEHDSDLSTPGITAGTSQLVEAAAVVDEGEEVVLRSITGNATAGSEYSVKLLCMRVS